MADASASTARKWINLRETAHHLSYQAPPPPWLKEAINELRANNPGEQFEALMKYGVVNDRGQNVKLDTVAGTATLPAGWSAQYLPRIRCIDCPGKLYNAGPDRTVENFRMHVANRQHKANVEKRVAKPGS
jgi:SWI/SNF-related matrix-associated actin-dependent regulator of chromatin subfamily B protein 1